LIGIRIESVKLQRHVIETGQKVLVIVEGRHGISSVEHIPLAGEIVLFNRSWYNRGEVERAMMAPVATRLCDSTSRRLMKSDLRKRGRLLT
jgi:polyphosphate kinase 2 (PPK2 family)